MTENKKSTALVPKEMLPVIVSCVPVFISYFIYNFVPESSFANDVNTPGMTAVYITLTAPVLCALSLVMLFLSFKKSKPYVSSQLKNGVVAALFGTSAIIDIACLVLESMFVAKMFKLGFAAPVDGTVYESYGNFVLVSSVLQLLCWTMISFKIKGSAKK